MTGAVVAMGLTTRPAQSLCDSDASLSFRFWPHAAPAHREHRPNEPDHVGQHRYIWEFGYLVATRAGSNQHVSQPGTCNIVASGHAVAQVRGLGLIGHGSRVDAHP